MSPQTRQTVLLVIVLLSTLFLLTVKEAAADYTVSIRDSSVSVSIVTIYDQNLTIAPAYTLALSGTNASDAQALVTSALNATLKGSYAKDLKITSTSTGNVTRTTITFDVEGVVTSTRDTVRFNMDWKSFKVSGDIVAAGISINNVGRYLAKSLVLNQLSSSVIQWSYFEDGAPITSAQSAGTAASFQILDFSKLSDPVSSWSRSFTIQGGLASAFTRAEKHNFTARQSINEGGQPITVVRTVYLAGFSHSVRIDVAGSATAIGNRILIERGSSAVVTMLALVVSIPLVGVTAFLVEWRTSKAESGPRFQRRRNPRNIV